MRALKTIEVCELPKIIVMAIRGKNIVAVGMECINLSNLLGTMVELHFNDKIINVFKNSTVQNIISDNLKKESNETTNNQTNPKNTPSGN